VSVEALIFRGVRLLPQCDRLVLCICDGRAETDLRGGRVQPWFLANHLAMWLKTDQMLRDRHRGFRVERERIVPDSVHVHFPEFSRDRPRTVSKRIADGISPQPMAKVNWAQKHTAARFLEPTANQRS